MGRTSKRIAVWVLAAAALAAAAPGGSGAAEEGRVERPEPGVFSRNWKGMLVDLHCGKGSADRSETPDAQPPFGPGVPHLTLTDWQGCPATAGSTEFGLVFYSGRAVRLDDAGNARMAEELQRNSK